MVVLFLLLIILGCSCF
ncbi:sporulation protein YjcZ [Vibrio vulnificus]|nr:sporulation protein YjcZ [Vibrio vulnificus]